MKPPGDLLQGRMINGGADATDFRRPILVPLGYWVTGVSYQPYCELSEYAAERKDVRRSIPLGLFDEYGSTIHPCVPV
jgi:hypothetical protein